MSMRARLVQLNGRRMVLTETPEGEIELLEFVSAKSRQNADDAGDTMPGGKYPIRNQDEANKAWNLRNNGTASQAAVVAHIKRQVKKHGLQMPGGDD